MPATFAISNFFLKKNGQSSIHPVAAKTIKLSHAIW